MPKQGEHLPGRREPLVVPQFHHVNGNRIQPPFPDGFRQAYFAMGCFWGAERGFWELRGVYSTAVGYQGGPTPNPTYREVCSGRTGHTEVVLVVFDPDVIAYESLLGTFWEGHDPTQGMRQGADIGTQYRSAIYTIGDRQQRLGLAARGTSKELAAGYRQITAEIAEAPPSTTPNSRPWLARSVARRNGPAWRGQLYDILFETDTRSAGAFDVVLVVAVPRQRPGGHARFRGVDHAAPRGAPARR